MLQKGLFKLYQQFERVGMKKTLISIYKIIQLEGLSGIKLRLQQLNKERSNNYKKWVNKYDNLNESIRQLMKNNIHAMIFKPKISILLPVYEAPLELLDLAICSVKNQIYPNWELCISDAASTNLAIHRLLKKYQSEDPRIKLIFSAEKGHISRATNIAFELATGDFITLLDQDSLLAEQALFWVARTVIDNPAAELIYSDEDRVDLKGVRSNPYFKPDWNSDLFLSHNFMRHLTTYRTDLVRKVGGWREGFEGAQDYDFSLRCIEKVDVGAIIHIPRILYHWRIHPSSTASSSDAETYATLNGEKALNDYLERNNIHGKAKSLGYGYRVRYDLPSIQPSVSIIIPTRNGFQLLKQCVESIVIRTDYINYDLLIIDNGSDDPVTVQYLEQLQNNIKISVIKDDRPFNYSSLNNDAVKIAKGEFIVLLNNDIQVITEDWLGEMVSIALQDKVGAVGACLLYPNGRIQHAGVILGLGGLAGHSHKHVSQDKSGYFNRTKLISSFSAVTAACLLIRKSIYKEVNGLDENLKVAFNDVDFCLRVREAGYRNVWTPFAKLYHHESATRGDENTPEKKARFNQEICYMKERWGEKLFSDPAYNPNLTLDHDDFSFAWPPRVSPLKTQYN